MKKMYVEPMGGMGNRFNCIISAIFDSRKYGYELYIIWNRNLGCAIKMNQLLDPIEGASVLELYRMGYKRLGGWLTVLSNIKVKMIKSKCDLCLDEEYMKSQFCYMSDNERKIIYNTEKIYISTSCGWVTENDFNMIRNEIIPKKKYMEILEKTFKDVDTDLLYGFHIRRTDHIISIQNCPTELFTDKMDQLIDENYNVKFYIATDDTQLEQWLREKYYKFIVEKKNFSTVVKRNTKAGMMDAFVDVLCLSRCKKIFGSRSTFSTLAAYLGNTELEMMEIHKEKDADNDTI